MTTWLSTYGTLAEWCDKCPVCKGTQFKHLSVEEKFSMWRDSETERCSCWKLYVVMQRLWMQEFPRGYLRWNWDSQWPYDLNNQKELVEKWNEVYPDSYAWQFDPSTTDEKAVLHWVDNPNEVAMKGLSLFLHGSKGTGKTALATVLSKEYTKRRGLDATGTIGDFIPSFLVCDELYQYLSDKGDWKGRETANKAMRADLLVLDDLRLNYTGYVQTEMAERLHAFLQYRAGCNLPTIITANKMGSAQDFSNNCVTEFLGISKEGTPDRFGKYRFIKLANEPLRPEPEWSV
jgi:DNA replication protein DnaC